MEPLRGRRFEPINDSVTRPTHCVELGPVEGQFSYSFPTVEGAEEASITSLKEQASELGGNFVYIRDSTRWRGKRYRAKVRGLAYRCETVPESPYRYVCVRDADGLTTCERRSIEEAPERPSMKGP